MPRQTIEVTTLHGYTIEELINMKDKHTSSYARNILLTVIMKYQGFKSSEIIKTVGKSHVTVLKYIKSWNKLGVECLKDNRGGSEGNFTSEMVDDLLTTVMFRNPIDYGFMSSTWTTKTLSEYIYTKYGLKYSAEWIRIILKENNFSFKRGQYNPTYGDKVKKLAFKKKLQNLVTTVENSSKSVVYALDETSIRIESNNHMSWSLVGKPPIVEKNGSRKGINIIGATEITKNFDSHADIYSHNQSITALEVEHFIERLLEINNDKKVYIILDNAKPHTASSIKQLEQIHENKLKLLYLPPYSPELNPQENVWNILKKYIYRPSSRVSIDDLFYDVCYVYDQFNDPNFSMKSLVYAMNYYKCNNNQKLQCIA